MLERQMQRFRRDETGRIRPLGDCASRAAKYVAGSAVAMFAVRSDDDDIGRNAVSEGPYRFGGRTWNQVKLGARFGHARAPEHGRDSARIFGFLWLPNVHDVQ